MFSNRRQGFRLRSYTQRKRSFDERVCDDLCEVLLQYLPIEDKFRLECVSKQFQKNIFNRQYKLNMTRYASCDQFRYTDENNLKNLINLPEMIDLNDLEDIESYEELVTEINCQRLEFVLKKCKNIREISSGYKFSDTTIGNIDEVLKTIINYCNHLQSFRLKCHSNNYNELSFESFVHKFGQHLKSIDFPNKYNSMHRFCVSLLKRCPNIESLIRVPFIQLMENNKIIIKNLQKLEKVSIDFSKLKTFELCIKQLAPKLTHLSIEVNANTKEEEFELINILSELKNLKALKISTRLFSSDSSYHLIRCLKSISLNCHNLETLSLSLSVFQQLNENSFDCFENFKNLRTLSLSFFSNENILSLNSLKNCHKLTHLYINRSKLSEHFFDNIESIVPNLNVLDLNFYSNISDKHLKCISRLKRLRTLKIKYNKFSEPNTNISITSDGINSLLNNCNKIHKIHLFGGSHCFVGVDNNSNPKTKERVNILLN